MEEGEGKRTKGERKEGKEMESTRRLVGRSEGSRGRLHIGLLGEEVITRLARNEEGLGRPINHIEILSVPRSKQIS